MPLPTISTPTYELTLPSSNRKIKYRPFLVKEEKILIIAMESQDTKQIARAVKDVLTKCILTKGIKVEKLSTFDIEYLFLNIRGKSVGEQIEVMVTCPDDEKTQVPMSINIDDIKVLSEDSHSPNIKLDDTYTLKMKYPSLTEFIKNNFDNLEKLELLRDSLKERVKDVEEIYRLLFNYIDRKDVFNVEHEINFIKEQNYFYKSLELLKMRMGYNRAKTEEIIEDFLKDDEANLETYVKQKIQNIFIDCLLLESNGDQILVNNKFESVIFETPKDVYSICQRFKNLFKNVKTI